MGTGTGNTLIVDDEEDMRFLLFVAINNENEGLQVVGEAADGDDALAMRRELDVDVVVLDERMPGRTGLETAEALLAEAPDLPIVLFSAYMDDATTRRAGEIGVRACVRKDDMRSLLRTLRELTGIDRHRDQ
jgi:DNA-binding NarL/FixJ family response regulator